jgi:prepilin-type N-terminal cleavage/methylation domain-containing protein
MSIKSKIKNQKSKLRITSMVKSKAGLTLVETLVSLSILAVGLLGVALMQVTAISGNLHSNELEVATELAQDMIERLKSSAYTLTLEDAILDDENDGAPDVPDDFLGYLEHTNVELDNANGFAQPNPIDARGMATDEDGDLNNIPLKIYTRTWAVTDDGLGNGTNMKTLRVRVSWVDKERQNRGLDPPFVELLGVKPRQ